MDEHKITDDTSSAFVTYKEARKASRGKKFGIGYMLDSLEYSLIIDECIEVDEDVARFRSDIQHAVALSYSEIDAVTETTQSLFTFHANTKDPDLVLIPGKYLYGITVKGPGEFIVISGRTKLEFNNKIINCTAGVRNLRKEGILVPDNTTVGAINVSMSQEKQVVNLSIDDLLEFEAGTQPFKRYEGARLTEMADSIKAHGIINPIIVRPHPEHSNKYEIISGHNRTNAAKQAGFSAVPVIIEDLDDDAATLILIESNFKQRHDLSFSEKARAYKLKNDIYKRQGKRTDIYGGYQLRDEFGAKSTLRTSDIIGSGDNTSGRNVQRYIRLTKLIDGFLEHLDVGKLGFSAAVEISYLSKEEQELLYRLCKDENIKLTIKIAEALRNAKASVKWFHKQFDEEGMLEILNSVTQAETMTRSPINLRYEAISHFFEGEDLSNDEIAVKIIDALTKVYKKKPQRTNKEKPQ